MISKVWRYQRGNDCFILNHQTMSWNYIAQTQWKNSYLIDMWSYSDTSPWLPRQKQYLFLLLDTMETHYQPKSN
jgi:hypothetical protein